MKQMKNLSKSLLILAVGTATISLSLTSMAGEVLRSPRDAANQPRKALVSAANDPDLLRPYTGKYVFSPRFIDNMPSISLSSPHEGPNVARAPRPNLSPKDPRFEAAWRANAVRELQVAPLK